MDCKVHAVSAIVDCYSDLDRSFRLFLNCYASPQFLSRYNVSHCHDRGLNKEMYHIPTAVAAEEHGKKTTISHGARIETYTQASSDISTNRLNAK